MYKKSLLLLDGRDHSRVGYRSRESCDYS